MPIIKVPLYKQISKPSLGCVSSYINECQNFHRKNYGKSLINEADAYAQKVLGCKDCVIDFENNEPCLTINEDLNVSNKNLTAFRFKIKKVNGDVNIENNLFKSFVTLPKNINGNLRLGGNYIKDFKGAQDIKIKGKILGSMKQNVSTRYNLTNENFKLFKQGFLNENSVKILSKNQYGQLVNILNEDSCLVKVNYTNRVLVCKTSDVDCLYNVNSILKE